MTRTAAPDLEGRSKKIWLRENDTCLVELVPSLRSFTSDREEIVEATGRPRLDFYELAAERLGRAGLRTAFRSRVGDISYIADYRPAPPFEVIVKNVATGSTIRKYPGLFEEGTRLDPPVVKFDYNTDPEDQPIGEDYLSLVGVPVAAFKETALRTNEVLRDWLQPMDLWDFCLVIARDHDGRPIIISEISPDCMRLRGPDGHHRARDRREPRDRARDRVPARGDGHDGVATQPHGRRPSPRGHRRSVRHGGRRQCRPRDRLDRAGPAGAQRGRPLPVRGRGSRSRGVEPGMELRPSMLPPPVVTGLDRLQAV